MRSYDEELRDLLNQIHAGSEEAAQRFVDRFGKAVLRAVRRRLHRKLRTHFDSDDFLQDVFATYFCNPNRNAVFENKEQLVQYLTKIARNKVVNKIRERMVQQRRNINRQFSLDGSAKWAAKSLATDDPTPSQEVQEDENWQQMSGKLTPKGREILELLRQGHTHVEITKLLGLNNTKAVYRVVEKLKTQRN